MIGERVASAIGNLLSGDYSINIDTSQIVNAKTEADKFVDSIKDADEAVKAQAKFINTSAAAQQLSNAAMSAGTAAINNQTVAQKALNVARAAGNTLLSAGIGIVVGMIATGFLTWLMDVAQAEERVSEAAENARNNIKELNDNFNSNKEYVESIIGSYDKLTKGVNTLNNTNISLSNEDYEEYLEINNKLAEMFPELRKGVDENNNALLALGEGGKTAAEGLRELLVEMENMKNYEISQQLPDVFAEFKQQYQEFKETQERLSKDIPELQKSIQTVNSLNINDLFNDEKIASYSGDYDSTIEYINALNETVNELYKNSDVESPFRDINLDIETDLKNGIASFDLDASALNDEQFNELIEAFRKKAIDAGLALNDELANNLVINNETNAKIKANWSNIVTSMADGISASGSFKLLDKESQKVVKEIVSNLSYDVMDEMQDYENPYDWITDNIISSYVGISESDRKKLNQSFSKLFEFDLDASNLTVEEAENFVDELINTIAKLLNRDPVELKVQLGFDDGLINEEVQTELEKVRKQAATAFTGATPISVNQETRQTYFAEEDAIKQAEKDYSINSEEEIRAWISALDEAENKQQDLNYAIEKYLNTEKEINNEQPFSKQEMISNINSLSEGFESLDKIMASIKDEDNPFDYALLDDKTFTETFSGFEDEYTNFIETVSDSPKDINACQSAFDELLTAWLNSTDIIDGLSNETAQLTIDMLSNMGVANAEEVVMNALAAKHAALAAEKYYNANASDSLKNATIDEYVEFLNEANCSDTARVALAQLELSKIAVNNTKIDTASDIEQVINLANAAGASAEVLGKLARAKAIYAKAETQGLSGSAGDLRMLEEADSIMADIESGSFEWDFQLDPNQFTSAVYGGGTKTNKGGGSDKDEAEKQFDWIETRLERLKAQREELNELGSSSIVDFFGISQEDLDRAKELFSMSLSPGSQEVNELVDIANRAKMSIGELQQLVQSGASANNRESYLQQVLNKDRELIEANKLAVAEYKAEYDNVKGLVSPEIQAKIESGDINIEEYSGDEAENIEKVQDAYEKYSDAIQNQRDYETQLYEDTRSYYENRINYINAQNEAIENSNNLIQAQMDYMQEAGQIVTASSYEQLIDNLDKQIALMEKRKKEQEAELQALISSEDFDFGEDSEAYYELQDAISETDSELLSLKTSQEEYNNTLLQMPIDNMDILLNMYQSITTEIENWGATLEASGKKLDQNYYQTLINNGMEIIDQYEEQADLIEDIMDEYDEGSDQWNELYDRLQNVNSEMSSMVQNLYEWNEALLQLPLDSINDYADNLQQIADAMSEVMSEYNTVIDAVVGAIDNEIDAINDEKDDVNDAYQDRIDALQDQLDLLDEQNEKKQLQLDLEQAQYELEQLRNQKTIRVIREGRVTYENDADSIRDAQDAVDDAEYNIMRDELEGQIEDLQDELDDINERYDDQIERLEEIANKWEEIRTNVEQYNKELIAGDYLGEGWQDKVISGNDQDIYEMFKNMYESLNNQQNAYNEQIENTQNISELLNSYIEAYKEGTITYQEAMTGMKDVLSQINEHTTALDNLQNILDFSGASNDTANNAESVLGAIQDSLTETANELLKSFETYNENSGLITEYTSSWEQLTNNVDDIKDTLEDVRDNLEDALEEARDRDEEEDDDDDDRGNRGATGLHSYKGPLSYDKGIANGLVGSGSESSREDKMKLLGLRPLDEDEVRAILHKGEAVFNPDQQNQLFRNFETAYNAAIPKITMPNIPNITPANTSNNVEISMGDVILPNVQDVDGFAKAMGTRFGAVMRQEFGRNIK